MTHKFLTVAVAGALLLGACGSSSKSSAASAPVKLSGTVNNKGTKVVSGTSVSVALADFAFTPTYIEAKPGTKLTVQLKNTGTTTHTFTIASPATDKSLVPGSSGTVTVTVPQSGSLNFYCRFHRGIGMQGAIVAKG
jgi:plastocyanin